MTRINSINYSIIPSASTKSLNLCSFASCFYCIFLVISIFLLKRNPQMSDVVAVPHNVGHPERYENRRYEMLMLPVTVESPDPIAFKHVLDVASRKATDMSCAQHSCSERSLLLTIDIPVPLHNWVLFIPVNLPVSFLRQDPRLRDEIIAGMSSSDQFNIRSPPKYLFEQRFFTPNKMPLHSVVRCKSHAIAQS